MSVALDSHGAGGAGGITGAQTSQTISATLAANSVLVVWVVIATSGGPPTITSVKWNTNETLSLLQTSNGTGNTFAQYGLTNPTSGTHNIVVTLSGNLGTSTMQTFWMSATGAGASPFTSSNSDNRILPVTTTVAGCLVADGMFRPGGGLGPSGTEIMLDRDSVSTSQDFVSGYQLVASPSTINTSWSIGSGADTGNNHTAVIIAPPAIPNTTNFFLFMPN